MNSLFIEIYDDHFRELHSEIGVVEEFLNKYADVLKELSELKEVELLKLVINLNLRLQSQLSSQGEFLSAEFIQLLARFRICIALTIWDLPEWTPVDRRDDEKTD